MKKVIAIMLIIIISFTSIIIPMQRTQAAMPLLVPIAMWGIPKAINIVGALLVAAGIQYTAEIAINDISENFVRSLSNIEFNELYNTTQTSVDGLAMITESVWNRSRQFVTNLTFNAQQQLIMNNPFIEHQGVLTFINSLAVNQNINSILSTVVMLEQSVILPTTHGEFRYAISTNAQGNIVAEIWSGTSRFWHSTYTNTQMIINERLFLINQDGSSLVQVWIHGINSTTGEVFLASYASPQLTIPIQGVPTNTILRDNSISVDWDIKRDGQRVVNVPTSVGALVGKTAPQMIPQSIPIGHPFVPPMIPPITLPIPPPAIPIPQVPAMPWTIPIPQVPAIPLLPSIPIPVLPPLTIPSGTIRWHSLLLPAQLLATRFPFSIPWDINRLLSSFVAAPAAPIFQVPFTIGQWFRQGNIVANIILDLNHVNRLAQIARWGILIGFLITLMMITRRLIV